MHGLDHAIRAVAFDPGSKAVILPEMFASHKGDPTERVAHEERNADSPSAGGMSSFSAKLMVNNIGVSLKAMALGMTYGIGTIVNAWKVAKARGRVLRVEGLRGLPARVFRLAELEPMLVRPPCGDDLKGNPGDQRRAASGGGGGIAVGGAHEPR